MFNSDQYIFERQQVAVWTPKDKGEIRGRLQNWKKEVYWDQLMYLGSCCLILTLSLACYRFQS